jgi:Sec-independent protein translocase protein TatA
LWRNHSPLTFIYSWRCPMQKLIVIGFVALCLIGTSSLALADEVMKDEMGGVKDEMKAEKNAIKGDMKTKKEELKGKMKARKDAIKAKRHEMKEKMKAHKVAGKSKVGEAKDSAQSMGQDMKATVPVAPSSVPAP